MYITSLVLGSKPRKRKAKAPVGTGRRGTTRRRRGSSSKKSLSSASSTPKPYACTVCGRRYCRQGDLTRHMKTHTIKNNTDSIHHAKSDNVDLAANSQTASYVTVSALKQQHQSLVQIQGQQQLQIQRQEQALAEFKKQQQCSQQQAQQPAMQVTLQMLETLNENALNRTLRAQKPVFDMMRQLQPGTKCSSRQSISPQTNYAEILQNYPNLQSLQWQDFVGCHDAQLDEWLLTSTKPVEFGHKLALRRLLNENRI